MIYMRFKHKGGLALLILVDNISGRSRVFNSNVATVNPEWHFNFKFTSWQIDHPTTIAERIDGRRYRTVARRENSTASL